MFKTKYRVGSGYYACDKYFFVEYKVWWFPLWTGYRDTISFNLNKVKSVLKELENK